MWAITDGMYRVQIADPRHAQQRQKVPKPGVKVDLIFVPQNLLISISQESTDSARDMHSLDNPATLSVKSGLQVPF